MISLTTVFWLLVLLFGIIGALRGWAKELLTAIATIWGITLIVVLERFLPIFPQNPGGSYFVWRAIILVLMAFFGYHTPRVAARLAPKTRQEGFRDAALGMVMGFLNGYLILATLWYYLDQAGYPVNAIIPPYATPGLTHTDPAIQERLQTIVKTLPDDAQDILRWALPRLMGWPWIVLLALAAGLFLFIVFI